MKEDFWLIAAVFAVWALLALAYQLVPMIHMPPSVRVWGLGALLFLVLACLIAWADRHRRHLPGRGGGSPRD